MFMLGTNDVFRGHTTTDIIAAYTKMVTVMRAANPKVKIIVRASLLAYHCLPSRLRIYRSRPDTLLSNFPR